MLIVSTEHPHFARCKAFAQAEGIPVHEISVQREDSSFLPLLDANVPRVMLALPATALESALSTWLFAPEDARTPSVVCLGEELDENALQAAWTDAVPQRSLIVVDHNLAARETVVWELAWGAAVPLFESRAMQKEQSLLQRARTFANVLQDTRKALDGTQAWTLTLDDASSRESRAGFIVDDGSELPRVVEEFAHHQEGLWHAEAHRWTAWNPALMQEEASWLLRGQGALWLNGKASRARGTDVFSLRKMSGVRVRFVGSV